MHPPAKISSEKQNGVASKHLTFHLQLVAVILYVGSTQSGYSFLV